MCLELNKKPPIIYVSLVLTAARRSPKPLDFVRIEGGMPTKENMTSREFCYWLQGYFELSVAESNCVMPGQLDSIKRHLHMVFKHEIDPSYPNSGELTYIHSKPKGPLNDNFNTTMRC